MPFPKTQHLHLPPQKNTPLDGSIHPIIYNRKPSQRTVCRFWLHLRGVGQGQRFGIQKSIAHHTEGYSIQVEVEGW